MIYGLKAAVKVQKSVAAGQLQQQKEELTASAQKDKVFEQVKKWLRAENFLEEDKKDADDEGNEQAKAAAGEAGDGDPDEQEEQIDTVQLSQELMGHLDNLVENVNNDEFKNADVGAPAALNVDGAANPFFGNIDKLIEYYQELKKLEFLLRTFKPKQDLVAYKEKISDAPKDSDKNDESKKNGQKEEEKQES